MPALVRGPNSGGDAWLGVLVPIVVLAVTGCLGGVVWAWWAEPPTYTVTAAATFLDEEQLGSVFGVEVRYAAIGLAGGFGVAVALSRWLRRAGWLLCLGMVLGGAAAAVLSYVVGVALGPAPLPPRSASPGAALAAPLEVQTYGFFLVWAVGALAGVVLVVAATDRTGRRDDSLGLSDLSRG